MILSDSEIIKLITEKSLISNYEDLEVQVQPAGFDITLARIESFQGRGRIGFSNKGRIIPSRSVVPNLAGIWELQPGPYVFISAEIVNFPNSLMGIACPRSTLNRCAAMTDSATIDPGYHGDLTFLVVAHAPLTIEFRARFAQLVFYRSEKSDKVYDGIYIGHTPLTDSGPCPMTDGCSLISLMSPRFCSQPEVWSSCEKYLKGKKWISKADEEARA